TAGNYHLEISYHRPMVEYLGYLTTLFTIGIVIYLLIRKRNFPVVEYKQEIINKIDQEEN
ncbi:MAG: hypothetical protein V1858_05625, partial [Candidatus Gottesmanbacteria bacterium]